MAITQISSNSNFNSEPVAERTHTVQPGENLATIAKQYNLTPGALVKANPQLSTPGLVYPGQQVNIPNASKSGTSQGSQNNSSAASTNSSSPLQHMSKSNARQLCSAGSANVSNAGQTTAGAQNNQPLDLPLGDDLIVAAFKSPYSHPLPRDFIDQYAYKNGQTMHLSTNQVAQMAIDLDVSHNAVLQDAVAKLAAQGGGTMDISFSEPAAANTHGTVGHIEPNYKGTLQVDVAKDGSVSWKFDGKMNFKDCWNFDRASHRTNYAETLVTFARNVLPGQAFNAVSSDIPVSQSSADANASWVGQGVQGTPSILSNAVGVPESEKAGHPEVAGKKGGSVEVGTTQSEAQTIDDWK